jgi:gamma-glutamylcyclotransferase (GGCT)/AIG2-like uncharacterized protein YtfP
MSSQNTSTIFAYGTLMYPELFSLLTGKHWDTEPATIHHFKRCTLNMEGYNNPPILIAAENHSVAGVIIRDINKSTLDLLDNYEMLHENLYQRCLHEAQISNGTIVPVYVYIKGTAAIHSENLWDEDIFLKQQYASYKDTVIPNFLKDYQ